MKSARTFHGLAPRALFCLTTLAGCGAGLDDPAASDESAILNGDAVSAEGSGMVLVSSPSKGCSGTLLANDWVLTAAHCALDTAAPSRNRVTMGGQSAVGSFAVNHPSLDVALLRLATPLRMGGVTSGWRASLYPGTTADLQNAGSLRCYGYGCGSGTWGNCSGFGTLRSAYFAVNRGSYDAYNFGVLPNTRGQTTMDGDSGGGCFALSSSGWGLAGVIKGIYQGSIVLNRPENWRPWALAYMNRTPVPLPTAWAIGGANPTFLMRPLPDNYQNTWTWDPCPGRSYTWTATHDLEAGYDFIYVTSGGVTVPLTGRATTSRSGLGPLTMRIATDGSVQSAGLTAMPVSCLP